MPAVMTTTTTTATTATANCRRALSSRAAPARVARVVAVAGVRLPPRSARARAAVVVRAAAADGGGDAPGAAPSLSVDDIPAKKPPSEPEEVPRPPLRVAAALAAIGSLESSYLAFEKLTGGEARSMHWSPYDPVRRGERRSLRTFAVASLRPGSLAFNARPRRLSTPTDAFELHPDVRSRGTHLRSRARSRGARPR